MFYPVVGQYGSIGNPRLYPIDSSTVIEEGEMVKLVNGKVVPVGTQEFGDSYIGVASEPHDGVTQDNRQTGTEILIWDNPQQIFAVKPKNVITATGGSTNTFVDSNLKNTFNDIFKGGKLWIVSHSGNSAFNKSLHNIVDFDNSSGTITIGSTLSSAFSAGDTAYICPGKEWMRGNHDFCLNANGTGVDWESTSPSGSILIDGADPENFLVYVRIRLHEFSNVNKSFLRTGNIHDYFETYGTIPDNIYSALIAAEADANISEIYFSKGVYPLLTNIATLSKRLIFEDGAYIDDNGLRVEITGNGASIQASALNKCFVQTIVIKGSWKCCSVTLENFGAVADRTTNCTYAFRNALFAISDGDRKIFLLKGTYLCDEVEGAGWLINPGSYWDRSDLDGLEIIGLGRGSIIKLADGVDRDTSLFGTANSVILRSFRWHDFDVDLNGLNNLQADVSDPLRYNCFLYGFSKWYDMSFKNINIFNAPGHQVIRLGGDTVETGYGKEALFENVNIHNFGIGLSGNDIADCSAIYVSGYNVNIKRCKLYCDDFTFNLARGMTAIEAHAEKVTIEDCDFDTVQLPILPAADVVDILKFNIHRNNFKNCNYMYSTQGDNDQKITVAKNEFRSTKSGSVICDISGDTGIVREIMHRDNYFNLDGNSNENTHIFYIDSKMFRLIDCQGDIFKNAYGAYLLIDGNVIDSTYANINIKNNTFENVGNTADGRVIRIQTAAGMGYFNSIVISGNTYNVNARNANGLLLCRTDTKTLEVTGITGDNTESTDYPICYINDRMSHAAKVIIKPSPSTRYHDYAAGTATWDISNNIPDADVLQVGNSSGAVVIQGAEVKGLTYTIINSTGHNVTIKCNSLTGVTIATGKTAIVTCIYTGSGNDYVRVTPDT